MYHRNDPQKSPFGRFLFVLGFAMFIFYMVLGLGLIFWNDIPLNLDKTYRYTFGGFLIVYSFLRLAKLIQTGRY